MDLMTLPDIEVSERILTDEAEEYACEREGACSREAVRRTVWAGDLESPEPCVAHRRTILLCLPCYDRWADKGSGLVLCAACDESAVTSFVKIVYAEPVRR